MFACWYDAQGPASEVLQFGELSDPEPAAGEVRVRITVSGVNPGDTKKRGGWLGNPMAYRRVIPHSDGAGVVDAVGAGVSSARVGERVWVYGAQSYRAFGTAAQATTVPSAQAVSLPANVADEVGACLGIPGITAHRCVFGDGAVAGQTLLVHGVLGAVGSLAVQLAYRGGATIVGTVRHQVDAAAAADLPLRAVVAFDDNDPVARIREVAPDGVQRIIEVSLSDNADLDAAVIGDHAVIAAYGTRADRPSVPFWPLLFSNTTLRMLGSDDFPAEAKKAAAHDLSTAASAGELTVPIARRYPLASTADSHDAVDSGIRGRVLIDI